MSTSTDDQVTWTIVNAALGGIMIKPLFIIWIVALCMARRRSDPARAAFTWMKVVFPVEMV